MGRDWAVIAFPTSSLALWRDEIPAIRSVLTVARTGRCGEVRSSALVAADQRGLRGPGKVLLSLAIGEDHVSRQGRADTRIRVAPGIAGGGAGLAACVRYQ
jgi:hypothetical protein